MRWFDAEKLSEGMGGGRELMAGRGVLGGGREGGIGFVEKERVKGGGKEEGMDGTLGHLDRNWRRSMPPHHCSIAGTPPSPPPTPLCGLVKGGGMRRGGGTGAQYPAKAQFRENWEK